MSADKDDINWWEDLMHFIAILAFVLLSCGSEQFTDKVFVNNRFSGEYVVDETIEPFVQEYRDLTSRQVSSITMYFGNTHHDGNSSVIGYCTFYSDRPVIVLNREWWDLAMDDDERFLLVAHELGHCDLLRDHTEAYKKFDDGSAPESIMYPYIGWEIVNSYKKHKQYYIDELLRDDVERIH